MDKDKILWWLELAKENAHDHPDRAIKYINEALVLIGVKE